MTAIDRLKATMDAIDAANPSAPMARLRAATLAARERTGNAAIGTNVRQGVYAVCLVTYQGKRTTVETLAEGLTVEGAIAYLNGMGPEAERIELAGADDWAAFWQAKGDELGDEAECRERALAGALLVGGGAAPLFRIVLKA